jgi:hypothetical protein
MSAATPHRIRAAIRALVRRPALLVLGLVVLAAALPSLPVAQVLAQSCGFGWYPDPNYCGAPGTNPCSYGTCDFTSGGACYDGQYHADSYRRVTDPPANWYRCYRSLFSGTGCYEGLVSCGNTWGYIDNTCIHSCSTYYFWTGCAALQGSTPCPG